MADFSGTPQPSDADMEIRSILSRVLHKIRKQKNREQVARELSFRLNRPISVAMLNDFTRTNKRGARFPLAWAPAFCEVTGDDSLLRFIAGDKPRIAECIRLKEQTRSLLDLANAINKTVDSLAPSRQRRSPKG